MKKIRTLKDYIAYTFDDKFWAAAENFVKDHQDYLYKRWGRKHGYGEIEIQDIEVKYVMASDLPGMKIHCDVAVEVTYAFPESEYRDIEKTLWLMVECDGDLECNLKDFEIRSVNEYIGKPLRQDPMDDALVPFISKDDLDEMSIRFLRTYYPEALKKPVGIDLRVLVERMGLNVRYVDISADRSIFGRIFFCECETELYDAKNDTTHKEKIPAGTILVDREAAFLRGYDAVNNTIVHECVHWDKHRKAFMLARLSDEKLSSIGCRVDGGITESKSNSIDWIEWQANALTPRIQMPVNTLKTLVNESLRLFRKGDTERDIVDYIEAIVDNVAITFGVSRFSAKLRLLDAGFREAAGAFTYIDGRYISPHTVSKGYQLDGNKTFSIGAEDAVILSLTNETLREELAKGLYQYVDGHFVLKHEKFLERDWRGSPQLTRYALRHMEECCLVFEMSVKGEYGVRYRSMCFLNRDQVSPFTFELVYHNGYENAPEERQQKLLEESIFEENKILRSMPRDYAKALEVAIKWRNDQRERILKKHPNRRIDKITATEIANRAGIHVETVRRTLHGKKTSLPTLVLICLALHLPPRMSDHIINNSPYKLSVNDPSHVWYYHVLHHCYGWLVADVKKFLAGKKVKTI